MESTVPRSRSAADAGWQSEATSARLSPPGFAAQVLVLVVLSWLPVPVTALLGPRAGWPVTLALAAAAWFAMRRADLGTLLAAVVASSALVASGLVTQASEYMPVAVTVIPLFGRAAVQLVRDGARPALPARPVLLSVVAYVAWAAVSGALSSDRRLSATYVAGMLVVSALAFVLAPAALAGEVSRRRLLGTVAVMAVVSAVSSFVLLLTGAIQLFDRPIGDYVPTELTLRGHVTNLPFPRVAGVFGAPAPEAMVLVAGLAAVLALRQQLSGRLRLVATASIPVIVLALLATQARTGWLMAIVAGGAVAAATLWSRRAVDVWSLAVMALFLAMTALLLTNIVGSAVSAGVAARIEHQAVADDATSVVTVRGGTDLSGRSALWEASRQAIRARPLLGWGPGTDATVIGRRLSGAYTIYRGLSSHSTWYRTAVEMGLPGLLALVAVLLTTLLVVVRQVLAVDRRQLDATWVAVLATAGALLAGQFFETSLLGGIAFVSLYWTLMVGLLASLSAGPGSARHV